MQLLKQSLIACTVVVMMSLSLYAGQDESELLPLVPYPANSSLDKILVLAAFNCDSNKVQQVLDAGADANGRYGDRGIDFMHYKNGGYPMAAKMFTPLMALAEGHHKGDKVSIAKLLLKYGAQIDVDDGCNRSALYFAVEQPASHDLACFLISKGCNVNMKVNSSIDGPVGTTPLHLACINGSTKIISALIDAGADVNALDTRHGEVGWTPLDLALQNKHDEAVQLLRKAGGYARNENKGGIGTRRCQDLRPGITNAPSKSDHGQLPDNR